MVNFPDGNSKLNRSLGAVERTVQGRFGDIEGRVDRPSDSACSQRVAPQDCRGRPPIHRGAPSKGSAHPLERSITVGVCHQVSLSVVPMAAKDVRIVETRDESLAGAMMVVGFPTHGLVGSVAASYLVHTLDMSNVAYMTSEEFPPTVIMEEGVVSAPVRFYASKLGMRSRSELRTTRGRDFRYPTSPRTPGGAGSHVVGLGGVEGGSTDRGDRGSAD